MPRYSNDPRWITARYAGTCSAKDCDKPIRKGDDVYHYPHPRYRATYCAACSPSIAARAEAEMMAEDYC